MFSFLNFSSRAAPDSDLPFPVYRALIESLFRAAGNNIGGVVAHLLLALSIVVMRPTLEMSASALLLAIACILRISTDFVYARRLRDDKHSFATSVEVEKSETRHLFVAAFFASTYGLVDWFALTQPVGQDFRLLVIVASTIFVVSGAGRCASSPRIVFVQSMLLLAPFCAAMLKIGGFGGYFAALMTLFVTRNMRDTTRTLHGTMISMLMANRAVTDTATKFDTALNNMSGGLVMIDSDRKVSVANTQFTAMFSLEPVGRDIRDLICTGMAPLVEREQDLADVYAFFEGQLGAALDLRLSDGRILSFSYEPMALGSVVTVVDVTAQHAAEESVKRMARYDVVTGLPNRVYFTEVLDRAIRVSDGDAFGLLSVDLDRFKEVNDSFGHHVGDQLLTLVADRIRSVLGSNGFAARFGGDEFMVLLETPDRDRIAKIGASLVRAIGMPYEIESRWVRIGASVGAALYPDDIEARDAESLLKASDMALYDAKASGRGSVKFFVEDMAVAIRRRRQLADALREAVANGELSVAYQPIVDLTTNRTTTIEALARWTHPQLGSVSPGDFIPIAEETGVIVEIGAHILERACRDALAWPSDVRVAVNLSAIQFDRGDLMKTVMTALRESGLPPERLELEITEIDPHRQSRPRAVQADRLPRPGHPHRARRFRHRLFFAELPQ